MKTSSWWLKALLALALASPVWLALPAAAGTQAVIKLEQAKVAYSDQDYAQAMTLLTAVLAEEPNNGEALQYAGLCAMAQGKAEDAVGYLEKATAAMPGDAGAWEDLAWANLSLQRYDAALAAADKALAIDGGAQRANLFKGQALIGLKRNEEALAPLGKVNSSAFAQAGQFYSGVALIGQGRTQDSIPFFKKAQDLGPNTALGKKSGEYLSALGGGGAGPAQGKAYNARVRLLYQYDTNIVTVNDSDFLPEDISEQEDGRVLLDADLAWHFINTGNARATARYVGYASWHFEETELNLQYHLGELSGYYAVPAGSYQLKFGASANFGTALLDNEAYSSSWTATPYIEVAWTKLLVTGLDVAYGQEDFNGDFAELGIADGAMNQRDNSNLHVTLRQYVGLAQGKVGIMGGYRWGRVDAFGGAYTRNDNGGYVGTQLALPAKSVLSAMLRFEDRQYPTDGKIDRHDRLMIGNVSYEIPIYKALHGYGSVVYTNVDSNQDVLEYERWIYGAGLVVAL